MPHRILIPAVSILVVIFAFWFKVIVLFNYQKMNSAVTLNNGLTMPLVGLGTWKSKPGEVKKAVLDAFSCGYRHIDAAWIYKNQDEVGEAIQQAISTGTIKRTDIWVTSKLWNDFHEKDLVEPHLRETLSQLKLDHLDLYLIHWPVTGKTGDELTPSIEETWKEMERMVELGLVKSIGVSNFSIKKLSAMKSFAKIFPAVNQVEMHPKWRQDDLLAACKSMGTHITAYSPLGSGDSATMFKHDGASVLSHPEVQAIAEETGKTTGQVLIRWALDHGTSVIPKSVTPERIVSNFDVLSWSLSPAQYERLAKIEPQQRMLLGTFFLSEEGPYRTAADLWDE